MNAVKQIFDAKYAAKENLETCRGEFIQKTDAITDRRHNFFYTSMIHCIHADVYDYFLESGCLKAHIKNISFIEDDRCGKFFQYAIMYCALKFFAQSEDFSVKNYLFDAFLIKQETYEKFEALILQDLSGFEVAFSRKIISEIFNQRSNTLSLAFVENFFYNSYMGWVKRIPA